jgi:glycosyltransferase involved in cell wall biosynthesis
VTGERALRVLLICPGGLEQGGGIGRQMGYFLQARQGDASGPVYRVVDSRGPWFLGASGRYKVLSALYLARCLLVMLRARLGGGPVLVHINITGRGSTIRKLVVGGFAQACGLPYVLHVHDYDYAADYAGRAPWQQRLVRHLFGRANRVIVLGARAKDALCAALHLPQAQVTVLHNAVPDPGAAPPEARDGECAVLFLGHLSARKGVPELLAALASPTLAGEPWRATIAGGGPVAQFQEEARQAGLGDRAAFPGWMDQASVEAACKDADILVLPSHAEGLAMAVLEGLSHGLAVVTTPVGAHDEVIETEISGVLVPVGDSASLAAALLRLIRDPALRRRLGQGARARFLEKFEIRGYAARLSALHAAEMVGRGTR